MLSKNKSGKLHIVLNPLSFILLAAALILYPARGFSQTTVQRFAEFNHDNDSVGLHGYDPVSYFNGNPATGNGSISFTYNGIVYQFATEANRDKFMESPGKYEPEYGGWCAYAMGEKGVKVDVNPQTYKIVNGKLYLFYNKYFNNTLNRWNKDESMLKHSADTNWEKIINHR